jgi:hypothetical protein
MGRVVRRYAVHGAIQQRRNNRSSIRLRAQRRIHLGVGVVVANRVLGQREVVRRGLAGHMQPISLGASYFV